MNGQKRSRGGASLREINGDIHAAELSVDVLKVDLFALFLLSLVVALDDLSERDPSEATVEAHDSVV